MVHINFDREKTQIIKGIALLAVCGLIYLGLR